MAGPKQHYIPQSFQRAFKIEEFSKNERVWCYRRPPKAPFKGRIADIAAERHFYSHAAEGQTETLDDAITKYENRLAYLLRTLQGVAPGKAVPGDVAAEVISHLTYRSKSIRHLITEGVDGILNITDKLTFFIDKGFDVRIFPAAPMPSGFEAFISENAQKLARLKGINISDNALARISYAYFRENADDIFVKGNTTIEIIKTMLDNFKFQGFRTQHAASLKTMFPEAIFKQLTKFQWQLIEFQKERLLLPDCIGIVSKDGVSFYPILGGTKDAVVIQVPLSPSKMLLGKNIENYTIAVEEFNENSAECSSEFFISNVCCEEFERLQCKIGEAVRSLVSNAVDNVLEDLTNRFVVRAVPNLNDNSKAQVGKKEFCITVEFPNSIVEEIGISQLEEFSKAAISSLDAEILNNISEVSFYDPVVASNEYAQRCFSDYRATGSSRIRADELATIIPTSDGAGMQRLCVNSQVLNFLEEPEQGINMLRVAASDVLLRPVYERYDAGDYSEVDQVFLVSALRTLRIFNRIICAGESLKFYNEEADVIVSRIKELWRTTDLETLHHRCSDGGEAVAELLERMSASMVQMGILAACENLQSEVGAHSVCNDPQFIKWVALFQKDLKLAVEWLRTANASDAGLILAAHLERLMYGLGITFEQGPQGDMRYEYRAGFPQNAVPVPFERILES